MKTPCRKEIQYKENPMKSSLLKGPAKVCFCLQSPEITTSQKTFVQRQKAKFCTCN